MNILKALVFPGLVLSVLAGCANEPIQIEASRKVTAAVDKGAQIYGKNEYTPWGFGVCYGKSLNTPQQVLEFARQTCKGGRIELRQEDLLWNDCPMIQGARASFVCYPKGPKVNPIGG